MNLKTPMMKISFLLLILLSSLLCQAQDLPMSVDIIRFPAANGATQFDINFIIPYSSLQFKEANNLFVSDVLLDLSLSKKDTLAYNDMMTFKIAVTTEPDTHSNAKGYLDKLSFTVDKPDFVVTLDFLDTASGNSFYLEKELGLLGEDEQVGDIEVSSMVIPATSKYLEKFQRDGYIFKVEPSHVIDAEESDNFYLYLDAKADYPLLKHKLQIFKDDKLVKDWKLKQEKSKAFKLAIGNLKKGYYDIKLVGMKQNIVAESFIVIKREKREIANVFTDLDSELSLLRYFSTGNKLKRWKKLDTDDARRLFATKFWGQKASMQGMKLDEYINFLRTRVAEATEYDYKFKKGWLTNQGRISILHGEPDEIITGETTAESTIYVRKNYEIWKYEGNNRASYLFLDIQMNGNYRLIHSVNDENEVSDSNWPAYIVEDFDTSLLE